MAASIGFIGLGAMGAPMVRRLLMHGYQVTVFDLKAESLAALVADGAKSAASVHSVADQCDIVFISLPNNPACQAVALEPNGLIAGGKMRLLVNLGTHGSQLSREIAKAFSDKSVRVLDAPVTGGAKGAAQGTLTVMVSGPRPSFDDIEPLLKCIGTRIVFVGESIGSAQTMKLANNLLSLSAFILTAEAMALGMKGGLDPEVMLEVINSGTGRNTATSDKFPRVVLNRKFNLGATTAGAARDIALGIQEAEALGVPLWLGSATHQFFSFALSQGDGPNDYSTLVKYQERWTGVEMRLMSAASNDRASPDVKAAADSQ